MKLFNPQNINNCPDAAVTRVKLSRKISVSEISKVMTLMSLCEITAGEVVK
jgi:hypothetical protein